LAKRLTTYVGEGFATWSKATGLGRGGHVGGVDLLADLALPESTSSLEPTVEATETLRFSDPVQDFERCAAVVTQIAVERHEGIVDPSETGVAGVEA